MFAINAWGVDIGKFEVHDQNDQRVYAFDPILEHREWLSKSVRVAGSVRALVFVGIAGGSAQQGDICIDNVFLLIGQCGNPKHSTCTCTFLKLHCNFVLSLEPF